MFLFLFFSTLFQGWQENALNHMKWTPHAHPDLAPRPPPPPPQPRAVPPSGLVCVTLFISVQFSLIGSKCQFYDSVARTNRLNDMSARGTCGPLAPWCGRATCVSESTMTCHTAASVSSVYLVTYWLYPVFFFFRFFVVVFVVVVFVSVCGLLFVCVCD